MPLNWKTPFGYPLALAIESIIIYAIAMACVPMICFTIGACWLIAAIVEDMTHDLNNLTIKSNKKNAIRLEKYFRDMIQEFVEIKQLSFTKFLQIFMIQK